MMIRTFPTLVSNALKRWPNQLPVRCFFNETNKLINVDISDRTGIAIVTMNRRPVNGLSLELLEALSKTLDDLENNETKGAILTSV